MTIIAKLSKQYKQEPLNVWEFFRLWLYYISSQKITLRKYFMEIRNNRGGSKNNK